MDALIMAGGKGRRMESKVPKPLIHFRSKTLIEWVIDAAKGCHFVEHIYVAATKDVGRINEAIEPETIKTGGRGYVADLVEAIDKLKLKKTLVLSADLPLLTPSDISWVINEYLMCGTPALAVFSPIEVYEKLKLMPSVEMGNLVPAGVNVVDGEDIDGEETQLITSNPRFIFNINTPQDLKRALSFAGELDESE